MTSKSGYKSEEDSLPLENRPGGRMYEDGTIVPEGTSLTGSYRFSQIRDIGAKSVVFKNCDFSYSVMTRAYFRNAEFQDCKFVGCYFSRCNFLGAKFFRCDFSYSWFSETRISHEDIFNQLPPRPNVRRSLAQNLRKNAESIGDTDAILKCFRYEMEQTKDYLKEAAKGREEYYKQKYPEVSDRIQFRAKLVSHHLSGLIWGHGESPLSVILFALTIYFILAVLIMLSGVSAGGPELATSPGDAITFGLKHSIFLMLSAPVEGFEPATFWTFVLKAIASLLGYTVFGLMVATIVRKYVRR